MLCWFFGGAGRLRRTDALHLFNTKRLRSSWYGGVRGRGEGGVSGHYRTALSGGALTTVDVDARGLRGSVGPRAYTVCLT